VCFGGCWLSLAWVLLRAEDGEQRSVNEFAFLCACNLALCWLVFGSE